MTSRNQLTGASHVNNRTSPKIIYRYTDKHLKNSFESAYKIQNANLVKWIVRPDLSIY
jgi:hypothetical protein